MMSDPYGRSIEATVQTAHALLMEGRAEEFLTFSEGAVELFPSDPELRLMYALALVPVDREKARWEAARAIKLDTNDPGRLVRTARLMLNLGEVEAARSYATRAAQFAPEDFVFAPELNAVGGILAAIAGEFELAEDALRAAHAAEPDRETFARDLARFLRERRRPNEALAVIDEAIAAGADANDLEVIRKEIAADDWQDGGT
jgi:Flp pilus assembly protein TadD